MLSVLALVGVMAGGDMPGDTVRLSLQDALERAHMMAPSLEAARGMVSAASAALGSNRVLMDNPEVEIVFPAAMSDGGRFEAIWRQSLGGLATRGARSDLGLSAVRQAELHLADSRRLIRRDVAAAFAALYAARARAAIAEQVMADMDRMVESADERLRAGEIAILERDMIAIAVARRRPALISLRLDLVQAEADLARHLAFDVGTVIVPVVDDFGADTAPAGDGCRPDLALYRERARELQMRSRLSSLGALPVPSLLVVHQREPGLPGWWGLGLSLPLPLWSAGRSAASAFRAESEVAAAIAEAAERDATLRHAALASSAAELTAMLDGLGAVEAELVPSTAGRLNDSYRSGRIGLVELLRLQDELNEARLEYWDAWERGRRARADLEAETPSGSGGCNADY